jgi:hypothetical protein
MKSGSLNLLEPSGPVKACNGIALPLRYAHYQVRVRRGNNPEGGFDLIANGNGRWVQLAEDRTHRLPSIITVLNLHIRMLSS